MPPGQMARTGDDGRKGTGYGALGRPPLPVEPQRTIVTLAGRGAPKRRIQTSRFPAMATRKDVLAPPA